MAHIVAIFATLFALLNLTMANFDLYQIHGRQDGGWFHRNIDGWSLHNDDPKCEEIDLDGYWVDSGDVSHGRHGIRCEGKCEYTDPPWPDVKLIEMHLTNHPLWHFTIYKDNGYLLDGAWRWWMFGIDGHSYGECFAYGDHVWDCKWPETKLSLVGHRKFRCITDVDALAIYASLKKEANFSLIHPS